MCLRKEGGINWLDKSNGLESVIECLVQRNQPAGNNIREQRGISGGDILTRTQVVK